MMNRISNRLIARFVAVAALLALVMAAPAVFAQEDISYAEGGTEQVASFSATDPDGDAIVWSLSGPDEGDFEISSDGVLTFKKSPDYENPVDEGADNVYNVTVNASGGTTDVVVTVTNVDEMGTVDIDDLQPQVGESVTATVGDQDSSSLDQTRWQWSKSMDEAAWEDISGATSSTYTPVTGDVGYYLRATATYSDGLGAGRDSASGVTAFAVEERPVANAQPAFADTDDDATNGSQQTRTVRETAKAGSSVGNPVTASDSDNDPLLYDLDPVTLAGTDDTLGTDDDVTTVAVTGAGLDGDLAATSDNTTTNVDVKTLFTINDKTGQISVKSDADLDLLDREAYATTLDDDTTTGVDEQELAYTVTVTVEDPSGSQGTVTVKIVVAAVNEAPDISLADDGLAAEITVTREGEEFVVSTPEQDPLDLDPEGDTKDDFATGLPVFNANDPENADEAAITWSISGDDAKRFEIRKGTLPDTAPEGVDSFAALRWADGDGPSFEDKDSADGDNVYKVTVTVFDGVASKSQGVSITVTNKEEAGSVTLTQRVPQQGRAITARLSDEDGGIRETKWQWYRGNGTLGESNADGDLVIVDTTLSDTVVLTPAGHIATTEGDGTVTVVYATGDDVTACDADSPSSTCSIPDATSPTYIPTAEDADRILQVRVTYVDTFPTDTSVDTDTADDGDAASKVSDGAAVVRPNANSQPSFGSDESVSRSVAENAKGVLVGDPVTATDKDSADQLMYALSGDGSDNFSVSNDGQITTKRVCEKFKLGWC